MEILQQLEKDLKSGDDKKINTIINFFKDLKIFVQKHLYEINEIANILKEVFIRLEKNN